MHRYMPFTLSKFARDHIIKGHICTTAVKQQQQQQQNKNKNYVKMLLLFKQTLTAARTALQVLASSSSAHSIFSLSGIHPPRTQEQKRTRIFM